MTRIAPAMASAGAHGGVAVFGRARRVVFREAGGLGCHSWSAPHVARAFASARPHEAQVPRWASTPSRASGGRRSIRNSSIRSTTRSHVIIERLQLRPKSLDRLVHLPLHGAEREL